MLFHLGIQNVTTVAALDLDLESGLTTITGETGAGKSVLLDALGLALGDRCNADILRNTSKNAEISASFQPADDSPASDWLRERDLHSDDGAAILRRVITPAGRSRAYINGCAVNVADLKQLGSQLVDLHHQHEHQSLLGTAHQLTLLDNYGKHQSLCDQVATTASQWQQARQQIETILGGSEQIDAQQQLLRYQVDELEQLAVADGESTELAGELKQLANAEQLIAALDGAQQCCDSDSVESSGGIQLLQSALQQLESHIETLPALKNIRELLGSALIQVQEAKAELGAIAAQVEINPQRLQEIESRLDSIYTVARKHQVDPEQLPAQLASLSATLADLAASEERLQTLREQQQSLQQRYQQLASELGKARAKTARKLGKQVNKHLGQLNMAHCQFEIAVLPEDSDLPRQSGSESIEFRISTVPGKAPASLARVASGGELSRISLAIQVVTAQTTQIPTLVFDEIDVGIGGAVAQTVGELLRDLGRCGQLLCVTHQAQVAAKGNQQLLVSKSLSKTSATTSIAALDTQQRKDELARMIGGQELTESTRAHAAEILESA